MRLRRPRTITAREREPALPRQASAAGLVTCGLSCSPCRDDDALAIAQTFASYAEVAMANAYLYNAKTTLAQHMEIAMRSRAVIEQAKGIIMGDRRCSADEAFTILTRLSQDTNHKLRDVAVALVQRTTTPKL